MAKALALFGNIRYVLVAVAILAIISRSNSGNPKDRRSNFS